jgi:predicted SAM-dependent methyltransferase
MSAEQLAAWPFSPLNTNTARKLHLGCGSHILDGWTNTDLDPKDSRVHALDVTKRFPISNDSVDLIFSEHMIEHLRYEDGKRMLAECHRSLKPGGKIRITTPNLRFLIDFFNPELDELQTSYLAWASSTFCDRPASDHSVFVLNNFVRAWGHRFIYDPSTLGNLMREVGFVHIQQHALLDSDHRDLTNLENVSRLPPGYLELESFSLQACKP